MIRIGRIAFGSLRRGHDYITLENAQDAFRFRVGQTFWTGASTDPDARRLGEHRVRSVNVESGVVYVASPIHHQSVACDGDWIFAADHEPQWSPYT